MAKQQKVSSRPSATRAYTYRHNGKQERVRQATERNRRLRAIRHARVHPRDLVAIEWRREHYGEALESRISG